MNSISPKTHKKITDNQTIRISIPTKEGIEIYSCSEILRFEAHKSTSQIYLANGNLVKSSKSLKHFEDVLFSCNFIRVHKKNLVNIRHVKKYLSGKNNWIILSDDSIVLLASRKKNDFLKLLVNLPYKIDYAFPDLALKKTLISALI